jgi:hypothetical protein
MSWNYRVVRRECATPNGTETIYAIHEAYYDKDGNVDSITAEPVPIVADNLGDMMDMLFQMRAALDKAALDYDAICREAKGGEGGTTKVKD